ncbi:MAG: pyruvate dehydrogenase, partial [Gammaproteobacteria bacterium]|nr:pyruvate dehydrogenase [Gammaproteobacteria bacterium]
MNPTVIKLNHPEENVNFDWEKISYQLMLSRALDDIEEQELVPAHLVHMQFSARGHDFAQIVLGSLLTHPHDGTTGYYRSRPFVLSLGVDLNSIISSSMAKSGGYSDGRDVGVVCNYPNPERSGPILFPMCGGVGSQYSSISGWAQSILYYRDELNQQAYQGAIGVSMGGDSSMSTSGFWAALNISTTNQLPHLFVIEDNGFGISTAQTVQTPGGDQVANLAAYKNLEIITGDGTDPVDTPYLIAKAVNYVRSGKGTCLLRLKVPRLCGHTFQDTQAYKSEELIKKEKSRDPMPKLQKYLKATGVMSEDRWQELLLKAKEEVKSVVEDVKQKPQPDPETLNRYVYAESDDQGNPDIQIRGGLLPDGFTLEKSSYLAKPEGPRINMLKAIRQVLDHELTINPRMLMFGEDVGAKGGVHAASLGLFQKFGDHRVFDTSLSEEGIIGRSVGMALAGLLPVPEIQFRKYAEPASEQLTDIGMMRWRTNNQFAVPMVVRMPGGFAGCGDPWHSMSDEVEWAHKMGWHLAMPSNAQDAVGLLRYALRDNNPSIFFEHRSLLDAASARRPYPGDDYVLPFGKANVVNEGNQLTVVTWGAMVERCLTASESINTTVSSSNSTGGNAGIEIIDLRTIQPWDKETVLQSV